MGKKEKFYLFNFDNILKGGIFMIEKRFPADTTLTSLTFLNDKKIDGELYALFQSMS